MAVKNLLQVFIRKRHIHHNISTTDTGWAELKWRNVNEQTRGPLDENLMEQQVCLGKNPATKSDESLKFQTAFDSPPPHFWKIMLQMFYNGYGRIYAKRQRPDSVS